MKTCAKILMVFSVMTLIFPMTGCDGMPGREPFNGGKDPDNGKIQGENPNTPDVPNTEQPQVNEEDLIGNADITGATAIIYLKGTTAECSSQNVNIKTDSKYGVIIEIAQTGTYIVQGTLNQGFIAVTANVRNETVTIVLNGVNIFCKNYAAISSLKNSNIIVELAEGSTNYLTDGGDGADADGRYSVDYDGEREPNAALTVRRDLTITGSGKLILNGNANNGIGGRANLIINSGDIYANAKNNAIKGNDSITINGGKFTLVSQGDGIKTDEESYTESDLGDITITGGSFDIVCATDGIQAERSMTISNAEMKIKTGGGSNIPAYADSAKGLKVLKDLIIHSGTFDIDSNDDSLHSDDTITINGGTFTFSSADDGVHANTRLTINGGDINIVKCYEGLESCDIDINGGNIKIKASDDGINIAGGKDSSASNPSPGGGFRPGQPGGGGSQVISGTLTINGGAIYVNADGDGIDSNGNILITGGTITVMGPTSNNDAAFDYDGTAKITGGTLIAIGSSGMAQQPGSTSTQCSVLVKFSSTAAGSVIKMETSIGQEIVNITTVKTASSIVISTPQLQKGTQYKVTSNGSTLKTFTLSNSSNITTVN